MNSFRVEELVFTFHDLQPFSDVLYDEVQLNRLHKMFQNVDKQNDDTLLRHVLCLVALMEKALQAEPPLIKSMQNNLIELTLMLEKAKSSISKDYIGIATAILFKYSAVLLDIQQSSHTKVSHILHSLSYHHLCSIPLKDVQISAWIAMHLLEEAAAVRCNNIIADQVCDLWCREDLAEYCVDTLIPSERQIRRLHACVYKDGMTECFRKSPSVTEKQIKNLFDRVLPVLHRREILRTLVWMIAHDDTFAKMAVFDDVFSKSFDTTNELNSTSLTSIDVKVFLLTLSFWSGSSSRSALVPEQLRFKADQIGCWKAICQFINKVADCENMKSVLLRSRVMDSVRLRHRVVSLSRLYEIFRWLEMNVNHKAWATLYAATIVDSITRVYSCRQKCDDLFPDGIGRNIEFTVDEIDGIEEHVSRYLASELLMRREFGKAEKKLLFASSIESKNLLIKVYEEWLAHGNLHSREKKLLMKRVQELKSTLDKNLPQNESITQSPSTGSGKTLIDACTNTPTITNNSAYLTVGDENETFPSFMDEYATPDTTFTSTIDTPHGRNTSISSVSKSLNADRERQDAATTDYMSKSHTLSVSATGQVAFSGQTNSVPLNNVTNCHTLGISPFKTIGFNGFTGVEGCSSGQFVDGISTSFWKSKYNVSMPEKLGGSISVSDREKLPVHDCKRETDMMQDSTQPELLPFGRPLSCGTLRQFLNPPLEFLSKQCGDLRGIRILEDLATDTPEIPNSNLSMSCTAMEGGYSDDDNFYDTLVMELCRKRLDGRIKISENENMDDMEVLQQKIDRIEDQIHATRTQLGFCVKVPPMNFSSISASELQGVGSCYPKMNMKNWQK